MILIGICQQADKFLRIVSMGVYINIRRSNMGTSNSGSRTSTREAEERRRREAEAYARQQRINQINAEIRVLNGEKSSLEGIVNSLKGYKNQLDTMVNSWRELFSKDMANTVLIKDNVYEGNHAENTTRAFSEAIKKMKDNVQSVDRVKGDVGEQISILEKRISNIGTQLSELYGELYSI